MALKLTEYELNYSTYLWIFKGKSSRNYEGRNRGVTLPDFMKIFHENFENELSFYSFSVKHIICTSMRIYICFCWSHPIYVFLEKSFGTKAFKLKIMKEIKEIKFE